MTPLNQQIANIAANGTLPAVLKDLMAKEQFLTVLSVLNAGLKNFHGDSGPMEKTQQFFDAAYKAMESLEDIQKPVFLALCIQGLRLSHSPATYHEADFKKHFTSEDEVMTRIYTEMQSERDALVNHPLIIAARNMRYMRRSDALELLIHLWANPKKSAFLCLYDTLLPLQNSAQREHDPKFCEESFSEALATHPGLELVVLNVNRGTEGINKLRNVPCMRIMISNRVKADDLDGISKEGWARGGELDPEFWIVTTGKTFQSLKEYLAASLDKKPESRGYGPYRFASDDDCSYATAANALAKIHEYVHTLKNFEAPAQNRMREQIQSIERLAIGKVYAQRFLRAQKYPLWAASLNLSARSYAAQDMVDYQEAAKLLTVYGFSQSIDYMDLITESNDRKAKIYQGFYDGIAQLHEYMNDLRRPGEVTCPALDWYETERGFHPDIMMLPIEDRKKLAFKDIGDIMLANLCGHMMNEVYLQKYYSNGSPSIEQKYQILSQIPVLDIASLYIEAGDVTSFMNLHQYLGRIEKNNENLHEPLAKKIRKAGFQVMEEMSIRDLKKMKFQAVINKEGLLYIRTEHMMHFDTVEKIVGDRRLVDAVSAYLVLDGLTYPESLAASKKQQMDALRDFMTETSLIREIREEPKKLGMTPDQVEQWLPFVKAALPFILNDPGVVGGDTPEQINKYKKLIIGAFEAATSNKRPRFERAVRAARAVSHLLLGKYPRI